MSKYYIVNWRHATRKWLLVDSMKNISFWTGSVNLAKVGGTYCATDRQTLAIIVA